jgi:hypothetical protein
VSDGESRERDAERMLLMIIEHFKDGDAVTAIAPRL